MKIWIIYSKIVLNPDKSNAISWMLDEASLAGFDAKIIFAEDLLLKVNNNAMKIYHKNNEIEYPEVAFTRCYDIALIKQLELLGIKTINTSESLENCLDKWKAHQLLAYNNITTPDTIFSHYVKSFDDISLHLGEKFIVKDLKGAKGDNVFLVESKEQFREAINACEAPLYQQYVDSSYGRDIRVHVIGNEVIASVLRESKGDFKSNFSLGGSASYYEANDRIKDLAIRSTKALNLDFAGVDILFTEDDYTVCEVNGVPGFRTVGITSDISIPREMFKHIKKVMNGE